MANQLDIRGKLTEVTPGDPPTTTTVVYQRVAQGLGNISNGGRYDRQRRAHVIPTDPRTPAQLALRAKFADAVAAWNALTPAEKRAWRLIGEGLNLPGYQAFISDFMR